jgi:hypothetical protein
LPSAQEEHDDPVPALYLPVWQLLQSPDASFDSSLDHAARYFPSAHELHSSAPAEAYLPPGQLLQLLALHR